MGQDKLIETLEAETSQKVKDIISEAQNRANEIIQSAKVDVERLVQNKLNAILLETQRKNLIKRNAYLASLNGNVNSTKYILLEQSFSDGFVQLKKLPEDKLRRVYINLLDRLLVHIKNYRAGKIFASSEAMCLVKDYTKTRNIILEKDDSNSGFVFISNDEKIIIKSTLESVYESIKPLMLISLKEILFREL